MHALRLALSVFGVIFVAELPDKTALAALILATRHRPWPVFLGASVALTVQSIVAVLAGTVLALLPARPVHIGAGVLFFVFAALMWRRKEEAPEGAQEASEAPQSFWRAFATVFVIVFLAEWGDLTQLATAALAARYNAPFVVFASATLALWSVAAIAVGIGSRAGKLLDPTLTQRIAAVVFVVLGVALVTGLL